jgi:HAD superfamily hydrolase (TIGR01549 family)
MKEHVAAGPMIKIISFDFDGTIVKPTFADAFWLEGVPLLYAQQYHIKLNDAKKMLFEEYEKIGENRIEWYDPGYWFTRFNLKKDWRKMLFEYRTSVEVFPEVPEVLKRLSKKYKLIISSNAKREFIDIQLTQVKLHPHFEKIFSSTSDFHTVKKVTDFYAMICKNLDISPHEMIHVGDHKEFDYTAPQELGITSYFLDRKEVTMGKNIVFDLKQFEKNINNSE